MSGNARDLSARLTRPLLWWGQHPYRLGVRIRNRRFDRGSRVERVEVPVVSIGNLTVGGTGKTPCVEYVCELLRRAELQVAVLSRGYGSAAGRNDEAMVLEENLPDVPHLQNPKRVESARTAIDELESELLVLDDGFQHRYLARDADIVLIDATDPFGYGYLLPRGGLREPISSLRRATYVVITRADAVDSATLDAIRSTVRGVHPDVPMATSRHAPCTLQNASGEAPITELRGSAVAAFCGIGNPSAFRRTLQDLGTEVVDFREYPDHHAYTRTDVDSLRQWSSGQASGVRIVTTQKDWVKLRLDDLSGRPLHAVRIRMEFLSGGEDFDRYLLATAIRSNPSVTP